MIGTDGSEEPSGTLLFAHGDPERVEEEALRQPRESDDPVGPLYPTYSEAEEDRDLIFVL